MSNIEYLNEECRNGNILKETIDKSEDIKKREIFFIGRKN